LIEPIINNEYNETRTLADGTTIVLTTGNLVIRFTNVGTGPGAGTTIVRHVSGPTKFTTYPDQSGIAVERATTSGPLVPGANMI
jgi:predicted membrane protein